MFSERIIKLRLVEERPRICQVVFLDFDPVPLVPGREGEPNGTFLRDNDRVPDVARRDSAA